MCNPNQTSEDFLLQYAGRPMSFDDAIELIKIANTMPASINTSVSWYDSKTGKPVTIGTTSNT
jgi:hypothetical protein